MPFNKQHGKVDQTLLKPEPHHLYSFYWSLSRQLNWKKCLLVIWEISGQFVKILNAGHKYSLLCRENLKKTIQMRLSQKQKLFYHLFSAILKSRLIFEQFQKSMTLIADVFLKLQTGKRRLNKCLKSLVSEDPSESNTVRRTKHCWNLNHTTFIILFDDC